MALILDIGANVGLFTSAWLKSNPNNRIVCVEANPALIANLEGLFYGNENVTVLNKLVSNISGAKVDFYVQDQHTLSTACKEWVSDSRFANQTHFNKKIQVETITLDDLILTYGEPNLIKIDVEGYEYEVLQGLTKRQRDIVFEWVEERFSKTIDCCKLLEGLGYSNFAYCMRDDYVAMPEKYVSFNQLDILSKINLTGKINWGNMFVK